MNDALECSQEDAPFRRLFLNVILRAVEEAKGVSLVCGRKEDPEELKREAQDWLSSDTLYLRRVCEWAGVDFEKLHDTYRRKYK